MSDKNEASVKAINYTADQVARLQECAPIDLEMAKTLADEMGKTYRSIIAKCLSESIEYVSKPAPAKRVTPDTKAEIVDDIAGYINKDLTGLDKATLKVLKTLREHFETELEANETS